MHRSRLQRALAVTLAAGSVAAGHSPGAVAETHDLMVPMRDGARLHTRVHLPDDQAAPLPAILARTPYDVNADTVSDPDWVSFLLARGYAYVVQDMRGRFASQGADSIFWTDGWGALQDGYDTVEWIAAQPWCDGNVGMHGASARGIVQYLAAGAAPPHLKACVARACVDDFYGKAFFQGGAYRKSLVDTWFDLIENPTMKQFYLAHPVRGAFWDQVDLTRRAGDVHVPILHYGGFYDVFGQSAIDAFRCLQFHGGAGAKGNQRLVIGPWTHDGFDSYRQGELTYPARSRFDLHTLRVRWYDRWLKGEKNGVDTEPGVDFFLMGDVDDPSAAGNEWRRSDTFPPPTSPVRFYLKTAGPHGPRLETSPPVDPDHGFTATYDPDDPVPTLGGQNLFLEAGPYDQRPVHEGRSDVLVARSAPILDPVVVVGPIRFRFWAECSTPDTDWCAKLIDVYPDGREMLVTDGILRGRFRNGFTEETPIVPGEVHAYEIDLWSTAIAFGTGHRIQLTVTGTNTPRFEVNPNTGGAFGNNENRRVANVRIRADVAYPSHLLLPVLAASTVSIEGGEPGRPTRLAVSANPASRFAYAVSDARAGSSLTVYDVAGRVVRVLSPALTASAARGHWDGRDENGRALAPGVYYLRLAEREGAAESRALVLVR